MSLAEESSLTAAQENVVVEEGPEHEARCVEEIVYCLLDAKGNASSSSAVQVAINSSLIQVAKADFPLVVSSILSFLERGQTSDAHQLGLVRVLCQVLETRRSDTGAETERFTINGSLARNLTQHLVKQVVKLPVEDARQQALLDVLVELAPMHPDIVLSGLLTMLDNCSNVPVAPTALVRILTEIAYTNPLVLEGRIHEVMGRYLPLLQSSKTMEAKLLLYRAWCSLCVAMVNFMMVSRRRGSKDRGPASPPELDVADGFSLLVNSDSTFSRGFAAAALELRRAGSEATSKNLFAEEEADERRRAVQALSTTFTMLMSSWPGSKDFTTRAGAMEALGHLSLVIPKEQFLTNADTLLELLLGLVTRQSAASSAKEGGPAMTLMRGLCLFLQACIDADPEILLLENTLQTLLSTLFTWVMMNGPLQCLEGKSGTESFHIQAEILRCVEVLAEAFPSQLLDFFLIKIKGGREERLAGLLVLRHLIGSGTWKPKASLVVEGVQLLTSDPDAAVGLLLGELIVALAGADFLRLPTTSSNTDGSNGVDSPAKLEHIHNLLAFLINQTAMAHVAEGDQSSTYSVVKLVAKNYPPADAPSSSEVRGRAGLVLGQLATSQKPCVLLVLWPMLLQAMVSPAMRLGLPVLCRTASHIVAGVKSSEDPSRSMPDLLAPLRPDREGNTQPEALLTWLLICLHSPHETPGLGLSILQCLEALSGLIHKVLGEIWEVPSRRLQTLRGYLEDKAGGLSQFGCDFWASALSQEMHFFLAALPEHDDLPSRLVDILQSLHSEVWRKDKDTCHLSDHQQAGLFNLMGASLSHVSSAVKVQNSLEFILTHSSELIADVSVRKACARGLGMVAQRHFGLVLSILGKVAKTDAATRKAGSLSFFGKSVAVQQAEHLRAMLALALGHCAVFAPTKEVLVEYARDHILSPLHAALTQERASAVLPSVVEAVKLANDAIRNAPESAAKRDPFLAQAAPEPEDVLVDTDLEVKSALGQQRDDLIRALLPFIAIPSEQADDQQAQLFSILVCPALEAISSLIELPLDLPSDLYALILEAGLSVLSVSVPHDVSTLRSNDYEEALRSENRVMYDRIRSVTHLIKSLLFHAHSWLGVSRLLQAVHGAGANCPVELIRWTCMQIVHTLCTVAPIVTVSEAEDELHSDVGDWCECLALILPRTGDSCKAVAGQAVDAVQELLSRCAWTADVHIMALPPAAAASGAGAGGTASTPSAAAMDFAHRSSSKASRSMSERGDAGSTQTPPSQQLASALVSKLPAAAIPPLVQHLMPSMHDADSRAALSGVDALHLILEACSEHLSAERASNLITTVFEQVEKVSHSSVRQRVLGCIKVLALHHFEAVVGELLNTGPDFNFSILGALQVLAKEKALLLRLLNYLTDTLNNSDPGSQKRPNRLVLAATVALGHLFTVNDSSIGIVVKKYFPQLFGTFLLRIGTTVEGLSAQQTAGAFMNFLHASQNDSMAMALEGNRLSSITRELYDEVIGELAALFCRHHPSKRESLLQFIHPFLDRPFPGHRVATATFLSKLLGSGAESALNDELLSSVTQSLLKCCDDQHSVVRKQGMRGLGNLIFLWQHQLAKESSSDKELILERLVPSICKGLQDAHPSVKKEAVFAMQRACQVQNEDSVEWQHLLLRSAGRLQQLLDAPDLLLRGASLELLGRLCVLASPDEGRPEVAQMSEDALAFIGVTECLLVSCVVRLQDPCEAVAYASSRCLQKLVPLLCAHLPPGRPDVAANVGSDDELSHVHVNGKEDRLAEAHELLERREQEHMEFERFIFPFVQLLHRKDNALLLRQRLELCSRYFSMKARADSASENSNMAAAAPSALLQGDGGSSAYSLQTCIAAGFLAAALVRNVAGDTTPRPSALLCSVCRDLMDLMVIEDADFRAQVARILGFFDILALPPGGTMSK